MKFLSFFIFHLFPFLSPSCKRTQLNIVAFYDGEIVRSYFHFIFTKAIFILCTHFSSFYSFFLSFFLLFRFHKAIFFSWLNRKLSTSTISLTIIGADGKLLHCTGWLEWKERWKKAHWKKRKWNFFPLFFFKWMR